MRKYLKLIIMFDHISQCAKTLLVFVATIILLAVSIAHGGFLDEPDWIEKVFGPPNINGIVGNGQLLAGISERGELTLFRWPTPSFYDQLRYLTISRDLPSFGAKENHGSFAGVVIRDSNDIPYALWFRDPPWECWQHHPQDYSAVLETICRHPELGIEVVQSDFVMPDDDVFVRRYKLSRDSKSTELSAFIYFENLAPCTKKIPFAPVHDWLFDFLNDFGLVYVPNINALLHFKPYDGSEPPSFIPPDPDVIDALWPSGGVFMAIGSDRQHSAFQCGNEDTENGMAIDAYLDSLDGQLSNNPSCSGHCTGALAFTLDPETTEYELSLFFAASDSANSALNLLDRYHSKSTDELLSEADKYWKNWLDDAAMPDTDDERLRFVCKRGLIAIKQCTDRKTGAIAAAASTQPPYAEDWPRDGAYTNYGLDLAVFYGHVEAHNNFYLSVQRKSGTFGMCYYSDGMVAGPTPFEIDEIALVVWTWWLHAQFIDEPSKRSEYLAAVYPGIKRSAEFLVSWEDEETGLHKPAWESDFPVPSQTLLGAIASYIGIKSAIEAAKEIGESENTIQSWQARLDRLTNAIWIHFYDPVSEKFLADIYSTAALIWPSGFLHPESELAEKIATELFNEVMLRLNKGREEGSYEGLITLMLAHLWKDKPDKLALLREPLTIQAHELATETGLFGEWWLLVDRNQDGVKEFENHAGIPHVETSALFYSTALLVYGDEKEDKESEIEEDKGCGCAY